MVTLETRGSGKMDEGHGQGGREVIVVIPVYRPNMEPYEELSLKRCREILGGHATTLVMPKNLQADQYKEVCGDLRSERFEPRYFERLKGYCKLMLSKEFYERFVDYRYILIYQLDAFVFSDQLLDWCSKGYDYVGAPWVNGLSLHPMTFFGARRLYRMLRVWNEPRLCYVGNGGFSLRNVKSCLELLDEFNLEAKLWAEFEDQFLAYYCLRSGFMKLPDLHTALQFSFEMEPSRCFAMNSEALPFGCHAWAKWDLEFWRPFFRHDGYEI
jgi:hypothetical protein